MPGKKIIPSASHLPLLVSGGQALVVDPGRDVSAYLDVAQKDKLKIKGVFLTHNHPDFVAGHLELAKAAGCPPYDAGWTEWAARPELPVAPRANK